MLSTNIGLKKISSPNLSRLIFLFTITRVLFVNKVLFLAATRAKPQYIQVEEKVVEGHAKTWIHQSTKTWKRELAKANQPLTAATISNSEKLRPLSSQQLRSNGSFTGNSPSRWSSSSVKRSFSQRLNGSLAGHSPSRRSSSNVEHSLSQRSNGKLAGHSPSWQSSSRFEHYPSQNLNTCVLDESYCIPQRRQEPE